MANLFVIVAVGMASALSCAAQDSRIAFEVASVKPNLTESLNMSILPTPGGRLNAENMTLKFLVRLAYRVRESQVEGGPPWISSARFDISARAETGERFPNLSPMLRTLLEDRFQLGVHRETKVPNVYVLRASKGGLTLPPSPDVDCGAKPSGCGTVRMTRRQPDGQGISMETLSKSLSDATGIVVIDQTGYHGRFDAHLKWAPADEAEKSGDDEPSLFAVLGELGLRLEPGKAPVEILVIDRAEKPSENCQ